MRLDHRVFTPKYIGLSMQLALAKARISVIDFEKRRRGPMQCVVEQHAITSFGGRVSYAYESKQLATKALSTS
ncbi:hypothetical protein RTM1035_02330 [Roseovarius sp. TM1035]|nr:hypothetical protein RTM1035_02330 [Roseovarius sp. TM1035]